MKADKNETLQEVYPDVKQMKPNNEGYDYLLMNVYGINLRIEFKSRVKTRKFDITAYQADHCDIFALKDENKELWFMTNEMYMSLCEKHSAWPKHKSKRWQLSLNKFRENSSKNLYEVADNFRPKYGTLHEFV